MNNLSVPLIRSIAIATITMLGMTTPALAEHQNGTNQYRNYGTKSYDTNSPSHRGSGRRCTSYEVSARGGDGAFRFMHNIPDYVIVRNGVYRGEICGDGDFTIELSKRQPGTLVALKINGNQYRFDRGERAHRYVNNWHRKYFKFPASHSTNREVGRGRQREHAGNYRVYANNNYAHRHGLKHYKHHDKH